MVRPRQLNIFSATAAAAQTSLYSEPISFQTSQQPPLFIIAHTFTSSASLCLTGRPSLGSKLPPASQSAPLSIWLFCKTPKNTDCILTATRPAARPLQQAKMIQELKKKAWNYRPRAVRSLKANLPVSLVKSSRAACGAVQESMQMLFRPLHKHRNRTLLAVTPARRKN